MKIVKFNLNQIQTFSYTRNFHLKALISLKQVKNIVGFIFMLHQRIIPICIFLQPNVSGNGRLHWQRCKPSNQPRKCATYRSMT